MIKAVIFDYNGVISNDFDLVYKTSMTLFDHYKINRIGLQKFKEEFEIPASKYWKYKLPSIEFNELNALYFRNYEKMGKPRPYPKAKETLEKIAQSNVHMFILSSHKKENIIKELNSFNIDHRLFDTIYAGINNKIEVIKDIVKSKNLNPLETAYVGDTEHDIEAGKNAELITIASTYGYRTKKQLLKMKPDYILNKVSSLTGIILNGH